MKPVTASRYTLFMADSVTIEGEELISSKRASKETGYTQDYIGQLARGSLITAKRVGGHWYVSRSSLRAYKTKADEYKPQPPTPIAHAGANFETSISFDGKEYISASHAAKLTGYHQDYVGQLARGGKVASRQIGNRWFIERDALVSHKIEKDSLLAAVQSQSVGLSATPTHTGRSMQSTSMLNETDPQQEVPESFFTYSHQRSDLMPTIIASNAHAPASQTTAAHMHTNRAMSDLARDNAVPVVIRRYAHAPAPQAAHHHAKSQKKRKRVLLPLAGAALTIVVVLTFGFTSLKDRALYALGEMHVGHSSQVASAGVAGTLRRGVQWIEELFSHQIDYTATSK